MPDETYLLLVDDDSIAHVLTRRALMSVQFDGEIVEVFDGEEACDYIQQHGPPLVILLDLRMPLMDGHEFLKVLSSEDLCAPPPQVFVVSSSSRPEDQRLEVDFPFVRACLEKPISKPHAPLVAIALTEAIASAAAQSH